MCWLILMRARAQRGPVRCVVGCGVGSFFGRGREVGPLSSCPCPHHHHGPSRTRTPHATTTERSTAPQRSQLASHGRDQGAPCPQGTWGKGRKEGGKEGRKEGRKRSRASLHPSSCIHAAIHPPTHPILPHVQVLLHAAKYPHAPVCGLLLGPTNVRYVECDDGCATRGKDATRPPHPRTTTHPRTHTHARAP